MGNSQSNVKTAHHSPSITQRSSSSSRKTHSSTRSSRKSRTSPSKSLSIRDEKIVEEEQVDFKKLRADAMDALTSNMEKIEKYTKLLKSIQEKLTREPTNKLLLTNKKKAVELILRLKETKKSLNRQIEFYEDELRLQEIIDEDAAANPAGGRLIRRKGTRKHKQKVKKSI